MVDVKFSKRLLAIIAASGYPATGYWVPEADRPKPLPPPETLPVDSSYQLWLAKLAATKKPRRIVEVGARLGSTIISMLLNCKASAVCIDCFVNNKRVELEKNLDDFGLLERVVIIDGDSRQQLPAIMACYKPDLVHIDGDHSYAVVLSDMVNATEVAVPPKWIAMHDLICTDVAAAWDCWHTLLHKHKWHAGIAKDIHNYPGFLELEE